ncbi:MAG: flagellar hook-associated protein 3 [Treponema sp.]|nr:flagellar hook-associated protein 3 [Spirochaetia bacterium]MDD6295259.1 flagellar hook-associated protein 3 [Treponema sp.]MDD7449491.1 flagellar hook-associated protein 3 [Treponema sp.]MDY2923790.1 flagellar hook-associated protein 3 [Treponema sp.]MDY5684297.1 flagellar hook-associated protein 3 [Treponema sp.]
MSRISSNMANNSVQFNLRRQEEKVSNSRNQIGSQQRLQQLRDDPIAAGHLVRYESYLTRVNNFEKNAQTLSDAYSLREGYMTSSLDMMQRIRELAVTGANGILQKDDLKNMAVEVDELLQQLVQNANAISSDGNALFGGTNVKTTPFDIEMGNMPGSDTSVIVGVRYNGNIDTNKIEIDENKYMVSDSAGNKTFWAEVQQLYGGRDLSAWQAAQDSVISIDGTQVKITSGDNVYALIAKINDSGAPVKASIDPVTNGLNIVTTDPHQLWLDDEQGTVLADIGIIKGNGQRPPYNLGDNVHLAGGSMFDAVIALRDAMLAGDTESIGGRMLGGIDAGISNLVTRLAKSGAEFERVQQNIARNSMTALNVNQQISREGDLDFTKAITDMKMLEYVYQATLHTAGSLYDNSLLKYMR